jgi:serine/threonine protein kinase/formylglycine-generating enzyme required for sulfatase activity/ribosomal protein L37AE/L43A
MTQKHKTGFGEIALEKGFISRKQFHKCRKESTALGISIEEILVEKGYLTPEQAEEVQESLSSMTEPTELLDSPGVTESESKADSAAQSSMVTESGLGSLFGEIAVEMGFATTDQIEMCSKEQARRMQEGQNQRLGDVCIDMGVLAPEQVEEILRLQRVSYVVCKECGASYDLGKLPAGKRWRCTKCNAVIEVPARTPSRRLKYASAVIRAKERRKAYKKGKRVTGLRSFGDYKIIEKIARGGMGVIYKAKQKKLDRIVALKVLIAGEQAQQDIIDRFMLEGRVVARLKHQNIVPIHDMGVLEGKHFFAMAFIHGESLRHVITNQKIPVLRALELTKKVANALHHAHEHGVVHRDVKPENVLIDETGEPQVTDFGLAKDVELDSNMTRAGLIMGTPAYMSPEQVRGERDMVDRRSDVYSLGAVMYEMLTRKKVLDLEQGGGLSDLLRLVHEDPVPPRKLNKRIPSEVETICLKALEKLPERRYQTAKEFEEDIDRFLAGEPIRARPASFGYKAWKKIKKHKAATAAVISTMLFVAITAGYFIRLQMQERERIASQVRDFLSQADQSLKSEDYEKAEELFTKTLALKGNSVEAQVGVQRAKDGQKKQAEIELSRRKKEQAQKIARKASTQLSRSNELLEDARTRSDGKKLLYDTIGIFDRALTLDSKCEIARKGKYEFAVALGHVSMEDKDFGVAVLVFSLASGLGVNDEEAKKMVAQAEAARRRAEEFDKLVKDAERKAAEGEWDTALSFYQLALKSRAVTPELEKEFRRKIAEVKYAKFFAEGSIQLGGNDYTSAVESFEKAKSFKSTPEVEEKLKQVRYLDNMAKGNAAREESRLVQAIAHYEEAIRYAEDKREAQAAISACREQGYNPNFEKALAYAKNKEWGHAKQSLEKALVFKKDDPEANRLKTEFSLVLTCTENENMTYVLSGVYPVGSEELDDNNPKRMVKVSLFFIDKYEVTNAQFREFVDAGGYESSEWWDPEGFKLVKQFVDRSGKSGPATWEKGTFPLGKAEHPVVGISWYEAAAYARWAGKRLPTKEEWEIAASWDPETKTKRVYPWGDKWNVKAGNFDDTEPTKTGTFKHDKSPVGCFDMGGNALEWTASLLREDYQIVQSGTFGLGETLAKKFARSTKRKSMEKTFRQVNTGFRCAKSPELADEREEDR